MRSRQAAVKGREDHSLLLAIDRHEVKLSEREYMSVASHLVRADSESLIDTLSDVRRRLADSGRAERELELLRLLEKELQHLLGQRRVEAHRLEARWIESCWPWQRALLELLAESFWVKRPPIDHQALAATLEVSAEEASERLELLERHGLAAPGVNSWELTQAGQSRLIDLRAYGAPPPMPEPPSRERIEAFMEEAFAVALKERDVEGRPESALTRLALIEAEAAEQGFDALASRASAELGKMSDQRTNRRPFDDLRPALPDDVDERLDLALEASAPIELEGPPLPREGRDQKANSAANSAVRSSTDRPPSTGSSSAEAAS